MFGALGWGIFATIAGLMVDALSEGSSYKNFESAFYLAVVCLVIDFLVSSQLKVSKTTVTNIFFIFKLFKTVTNKQFCQKFTEHKNTFDKTV